MIAKVACLCAIMAAVQPRSMLFGASILHSTIDNNSVKSHMKSSQRKWDDSHMDAWDDDETFYETANKVFGTVKQHIKCRNYEYDATAVFFKMSTHKFTAINEYVEKDEISYLESDQKSCNTPAWLVSDNDNKIDRLSNFSNMSCIKDVVFQKVPTFCAL